MEVGPHIDELQLEGYQVGHVSNPYKKQEESDYGTLDVLRLFVSESVPIELLAEWYSRTKQTELAEILRGHDLNAVLELCKPKDCETCGGKGSVTRWFPDVYKDFKCHNCTNGNVARWPLWVVVAFQSELETPSNNPCGIFHERGGMTCDRHRGHDGNCWYRGSDNLAEWISKEGQFRYHIAYRDFRRLAPGLRWLAETGHLPAFEAGGNWVWNMGRLAASTTASSQTRCSRCCCQSRPTGSESTTPSPPRSEPPRVLW